MQTIHCLFGAISEQSIIDSSKVASESPECRIWVFLMCKHLLILLFCMQLLKNHSCTFPCSEFIGLLSFISGDDNLITFHAVVTRNIELGHFNFKTIEAFLFSSLFYAFHFQIKTPHCTAYGALFCCWNRDGHFSAV